MGKVTQSYLCPSCNSSLVFKHVASNYHVCSNCDSVIQRDANDSVVATKQGSFINTISPIQIGSCGVWQNKPFEIIGGVRCWMQETVFHYWTILFSDNTIGLLSEGYGLYTICIETKLNQVIHHGTLNTLKIGDKKSFELKATFVLTQKFNVVKMEFMGEVWFNNNSKSIEIFEFAASNGNRLEFHQSLLQNVTAFKAHSTSFKELELTKLSETKNETPTIIECNYCGTKNEIKLWPYTQSFGCMGCKTKYQINQNEKATIKGTNTKEEKFQLAINSKGKLFDVDYEIVGYAEKEEKNIYKSKWREYVLWNREEGFAFLSEYDGHWIFVKEKNDTPTLDKGNVGQFNYDGKIFDIYNRYRYNIIQSKGIFPYNIYDDDALLVEEFICPPEVWIVEKSDQEGITWYHGQHIDKKEIEAAFHVSLPNSKGVGAVEPRGTISLFSLKIFTAIIIALALIVHLIVGATLQEKVVFEQNFYLNDSTKTINEVTQQFELTKSRSNLAFDLTAPLDNNWISLDIQLINSKTGEEYNLSQGLEYYSGYEGGEHWSEGDKTTRNYISSLPKGNYYLKVQSTLDTYKPVSDFNLTVTNDVSMSRNVVIIMILLLIGPLGYYAYSKYIEMERWRNSEFSPYHNNY